MTTYHRFFVSQGSFISRNEMEAIVLGTCVGCSLDKGLVRINDVEIGVIELTPRDNPMFEDDWHLVLEQAKARKLDEYVIDKLQDSVGFLLFQTKRPVRRMATVVMEETISVVSRGDTCAQIRGFCAVFISLNVRATVSKPRGERFSGPPISKDD